MGFLLLSIAVAFAVGFAMKRGGLCTYAAVLQIVQQRRVERLLAFLAASAWAALVTLPLYRWTHSASAPLMHDDVAVALAGGILLGFGAWINRGCVFGTFVQLVGGNLNYLATLLGMMAGVLLVSWWPANWLARPRYTPPVLQAAEAGMLWWAGVAGFGLFMLWRTIQHARGQQHSPWLAAFIMLAIGAGGGWLFAVLSGWDFAAVLTRLSFHLYDTARPLPRMITVLTTLAMVAGGIVAAVSAGRFVLRRPRLQTVLACFAGGLLMGLASMVVPGGNDGLLLKGIPVLAMHALIGWLAMVASMWLLLLAFRNDSGYVHSGGSR